MVLPDEEYIEYALKVIENFTSGAIKLYAPSILPLEITNALWRAVKLKRLTQSDAQLALKTLQSIHIDLYEINWAEAAEVIDIAHEFDIAIYDAAYIFLSNRLQAMFITADNKLVHKAKEHFRLLHLKDYI